jgi:hypothetical protein
MSKFSVSNPSFIGRLRDRLRFRHHFATPIDLALTGEEINWAETIRRDGFVQIPNFIESSLLRTLQSELGRALDNIEFETPCLAQSRIDPVRHADLLASKMYATPRELAARGLVFDRHDVLSYEQAVRDFNPSTLTLYMLQHSAAYREAWLDERLLRCVYAYLGMIPYLVEAYVRRNFPAPYHSMNHFWHRDLNSQYLLKAFFFLSDCSVDNGPHEFIQGTHNQLDVLNGKRYFDDEEVDAVFSPRSSRRLVSEVKAGTLIIEDTRGLHRARMPNAGYRDLGYAVFMPMLKRQAQALYTLDRGTFECLTTLQKRFIPPGFLVGS